MQKRDEAIHRIIEAIKEVGPRNISEIARITRLPIETVRYKVRKQLEEKGVRIRVTINHGKLGLARYWLNLYFNDEFKSNARYIFEILAQKGYLTYYARTLPRGSYAMMLVIPPSIEKEYREMLNELVRIGILEDYKLWRITWIRHLSMRPEYYDFNSGEWVIDWKKLSDEVLEIEDMVYESRVEGEPKIDRIDLLILAYLQINSFIPISKIAEKIGENTKKVRYHYLEHVVRRSLINKYVINWVDQKARETVHLIFQFKDLSKRELILTENFLLKIPFTWFDALSQDENLYLAMVPTPLNHYFNILYFLSENIPRASRKCEVSVVDLSSVKSYTIPFDLFDEKNRRWTFNHEEILEVVKVLVAAK